MSGTVTLDIEVIQQWFDWLLAGDEISLRHDLEEVLTHPERCQPSDAWGLDCPDAPEELLSEQEHLAAIKEETP